MLMKNLKEKKKGVNVNFWELWICALENKNPFLNKESQIPLEIKTHHVYAKHRAKIKLTRSVTLWNGFFMDSRRQLCPPCTIWSPRCFLFMGWKTRKATHFFFFPFSESFSKASVFHPKEVTGSEKSLT